MNESLFDLKKNAFKTLVNFVSTVKPKLFRKIKDLQKRVVKSYSQRIGIAEGWGIEFRQARQPKLINDLLMMIYS